MAAKCSVAPGRDAGRVSGARATSGSFVKRGRYAKLLWEKHGKHMRKHGIWAKYGKTWETYGNICKNGMQNMASIS